MLDLFRTTETRPGAFPRQRRVNVFLLQAAVFAWAATPACASDPVSTLVSIGTGGSSGVYYLAGGSICGLLDNGRWEHGVRCLARESDGSIDNLRAVRSGDETFGIVQSDWQYLAVQGESLFEAEGPDRELRSVFSLFPEPFTVVARPDAGISTFTDIKGKRVSFGPAGSGSRATMGMLMEALDWSDADFAYVSDLGMSAVPRALCAGEIDAAILIVANPNLTVEDAVTSCDAAIIPVEDSRIDRLVAERSYYFNFEIPAGTYPGHATAVPVFALAATLVTSSRTPPTIVYELVKAVFEDFDSFRDSHPAFEDLEKANMTAEGLTAPIHEGAMRYFRESGLK